MISWQMVPASLRLKCGVCELITGFYCGVVTNPLTTAHGFCFTTSLETIDYPRFNFQLRELLLATN